jgi:hypothetical protein
MDTAISGDRNVIKTEANKILKYKDLVIYCNIEFNMTCTICEMSQIQYILCFKYNIFNACQYDRNM